MKIVGQRNTGFKQQIMIDGIVDNEVRGRNFKGMEKMRGNIPVNKAGYRNFLLYIPEDIAEVLRGYNCDVKYTIPRDDNDVSTPYVVINISWYLANNMNGKPPEIHLIRDGGDTLLDEAHAYILDDVDFINLGLVLEVGGKEKSHKDGSVYHALYATEIWAETVSNYFSARYSYLNNPAASEEAVPFT